MKHEYSEPVRKLLAYEGYDAIRKAGDAWPDYLELGLAEDHVPELIGMISDQTLHNASGDSLEVWAPLHAWRALGQLKAVEACEPLVRLYQILPNDDWASVELPKVFSLIGPAAIPAIQGYLCDNAVDELHKIAVPSCLEFMALDHPGHRDDCIAILEEQLSFYKTNGEGFNAFLILSLVKLQARDAIETIRAAFNAGLVDITVMGDLEDVEMELGLRSQRETPRPKMHWGRDFPGLARESNWQSTLHSPSSDTITNPFKHIGRNDPCPCGSGKKYKKCCLD